MHSLKAERDAIRDAVAVKLQVFLDRSGLTQTQFADKAGVSRVDVNRALKAKTLAGPHILKRFATAIGESLDSFTSIAAQGRENNVSSRKKSVRKDSHRNTRRAGVRDTRKGQGR